jgi:hypothetical protein
MIPGKKSLCLFHYKAFSWYSLRRALGIYASCLIRVISYMYYLLYSKGG